MHEMHSDHPPSLFWWLLNRRCSFFWVVPVTLSLRVTLSWIGQFMGRVLKIIQVSKHTVVANLQLIIYTCIVCVCVYLYMGS